MHDRHLMIDLETLSTENDAAIVAVGAVTFDLETILETRLWLIDPKLSPGRRDVSTLEWWSRQNPVTRDHMLSGKSNPFEFGIEFAEWVGPLYEEYWIWAGPSTFDLTILKTFFQQHYGFPYPLNWRMHRDLTTLSRLADELGIDYSGEGFEGFREHNALDDAIKQARRCQIILKELANRFDTRIKDPRNSPVCGLGE